SRDDLGERRGVEDSVHGHGLGGRHERAVTVGFAIDHLPVVADDNHGSGNQVRLNSAVDLRVHIGCAAKGLLRTQAGCGQSQGENGSHCSLFASVSRSFASSTSLDVMPPASWVVRSTLT